MNNILILSKIKRELKKRDLKSNKEVLLEVDRLIKKDLKDFFDILSYNMKIEGKKTVSKKDVLNAMNKLKKKEELYDII